MTYNPDHVFINVEITSITPTDIERWMKYQAYGEPEPVPDARQTHLLGTSLLVAKEKFLFSRLPPWYPGCFSSNPTKSIKINNQLNEVEKHKCVQKSQSLW
jgi:hypothetical protein